MELLQDNIMLSGCFKQYATVSFDVNFHEFVIRATRSQNKLYNDILNIEFDHQFPQLNNFYLLNGNLEVLYDKCPTEYFMKYGTPYACFKSHHIFNKRDFNSGMTVTLIMAIPYKPDYIELKDANLLLYMDKDGYLKFYTLPNKETIMLDISGNPIKPKIHHIYNHIK